MQNESLEMAQVTSLVLALSAGKSAREMQSEALALIEAARSINWPTAEQCAEAQLLVVRLEHLLAKPAAGKRQRRAGSSVSLASTESVSPTGK
jgi:hypothetical protein